MTSLFSSSHFLSFTLKLMHCSVTRIHHILTSLVSGYNLVRTFRFVQKNWLGIQDTLSRSWHILYTFRCVIWQENERDKMKINTMIPHKKEFELWTINTKIKQLWTSVSKIRVSTFQRLLSAFLNILRSHNLKTIYISSILFLKIFMINYKFLHITDQSRGKKYTTVETFLMKIGKIFCHDLFRLKETKKIIPLLK